MPNDAEISVTGFSAGLQDFIMIYRRFSYVVDIENKFEIFYHFN